MTHPQTFRYYLGQVALLFLFLIVLLAAFGVNR